MEKSASARRQAQWLTDKYILLMMLVFPLFTGLHGYSRIAQAKFGCFLVLTLIWLAGLTACVFRGLRPASFSAESALWLLLVFLDWAILASLFSPFGVENTLTGGGRQNGLLSLFLYVITAILVARLARPRREYIWALGLSVFLCCGVAIVQIAGSDPLGLYPHGWRYADAGIRYSGMYLGTVGNTLILSSVLSLALPLLILTALRDRGWEWLLLLPAAMAVFVLWKSGSSSAAVALLGSTLLCLPMAAPRRYRRCILLAEGAFILLGLALLWFWPGTSGTVYEASRLLHGDVSDSFGSSRIKIWRAVWELVPERPLFGGGSGTLPQRIDVTFSRFVPETGETLRSYVANAHNEYLGYLADLGIPGLAIYLAAMGLAFFSPRWRSEDHAILGWGICAYWIQAFFALGLPLSAPLLWIFWGLFLTPYE